MMMMMTDSISQGLFTDTNYSKIPSWIGPIWNLNHMYIAQVFTIGEK